MMTEFQLAYRKTMNHEGLYSDNPRDRGGETCMGISRNNWPDWEGWIHIDFLKKYKKTEAELVIALQNYNELKDLAEQFYRDNFWKKLRLDEFDSALVCSELFDQAVNLGVHAASKHIQRALNLLNNNQKHYKDLVVDGIIGLKTIDAFRAYMNTASIAGRSRERNSRTIVKILNALQFERYSSNCESDPTQKAFLYGWLNRV